MKSRDEVFELFGLEDNEQGRKALRYIGANAVTMTRLKDEIVSQGIHHSASAIWTVIKWLVLGGIGYGAWKAGLIQGPK